MKAKPTRYSDEKAIKVHQLRLAGMSWGKIHKQLGIAVSTACAWDRIVVSDPELLRKAETEKHPGKNGKAKMESPTLKDMTLNEENAYLRWWNQGERRGWVDRLLREIQK